MNTNQARETLFRYRGPIDDADSQFEEALRYARRDPELAEWMHEQSSCYDAIRSKLREIEPPSDFAGERGEDDAFSEGASGLWGKWLACLVMVEFKR